jgi:hypothetical protein
MYLKMETACFFGTFIIIYKTIYLWLYSPLLDLGRFFSFLILYTVGRTPWTGDQPVARPLPTHRTTQTQNKGTQTSMHWLGFEHTIPAFEDSSCLSRRGHCDRHLQDYTASLSKNSSLNIFRRKKLKSHKVFLLRLFLTPNSLKT